MSTAASTRTAYYVLSTHWDREWYEPFQFYRFRLVQLLDRVLEGYRTGELKGPFTMDGQAILIEDYLEIRPERRDEVLGLLRDGRLLAGPWYILPDEFIVSGESLVRNLRFGHDIPAKHGAEPSHSGFVCDLFGHISQLPQIFRGFGIESAYLWRGINIDNTRHFLWTGADGSEVLAYCFANEGYSDFAFKVRGAGKSGHAPDASTIPQSLETYLRNEAEHTVVSPVLAFDGGDHQEWDRTVYTAISARLGSDREGITLTHGSLDDYTDAMLAERDRVTERRNGELREPGKIPGKAPHQIHGVLSSRVWIKQWNHRCETLLTAWAEPFSVLAQSLLGDPSDDGFLRAAWKHLVRNHPHDSICGCSVDRVHEDMKFRFSQCEQIADRLTLQATRRLAAEVEGDIAPGEVRIVVYNPATVELDGPVRLVLDIPEDYPVFQEFFGFEKKPAFRVYTPEGREVPYQRDGQSAHRVRTRIRDTQFPDAYHVTEVAVTLPLSVPAMGYATLVIRPGSDRVPTRHPQDTGIATSQRTLENEHLHARVESNGTLTLTDKRTGNIYTDLLVFEDAADIGDGWFHGMAINDESYSSVGTPAEIGLVENGPFAAAFRIRHRMAVPAAFDFSSMRRGEDRRELLLDTVVRLRAGATQLDVETRVDNTAKDHRLRVQFSSGVDAGTFLTDQAFDVVERNVALRADNHEYHELEVETRPQQSWIAVASGGRGLAVLADGLKESCVRDQADRPISLTLLRCTRRTVLTDGEPNGQLLGEHRFRYAIRPLDGGVPRAELFRESALLAAGLRVVQQRDHDQREYRRNGASLPSRAGLLTLEGGAVLTSVRRVGDTVEVRLFNPEEWTIEVGLALGSLAGNACAATPVDLRSRPTGDPLPIENGRLALRLAAKQILTLSIA